MLEKNWIPFFSQTGSEIADIIEQAGVKPAMISTNTKTPERIDKRLKDHIIINFNKFSDLDEYYEDLNNSVVTLHGFLRIIPKQYITKEMYNGHPGLITKYPELKGFNPQERAFNLKLPTSGSVIHKVIEEVDSGEVLLYNEVSIENLSLDEVYKTLKQSSLNLWLEFFK